METFKWALYTRIDSTNQIFYKTQFLIASLADSVVTQIKLAISLIDEKEIK